VITWTTTSPYTLNAKFSTTAVNLISSITSIQNDWINIGANLASIKNNVPRGYSYVPSTPTVVIVNPSLSNISKRFLKHLKITSSKRTIFIIIKQLPQPLQLQLQHLLLPFLILILVFNHIVA